MLSQNKIEESLSGLINWMDTWKTKEGAYNGFVVHRTETKRMFRLHDTAWTQSAIIRGYSNLYEKTRADCWYNRMVEAADLQASRYDPATGYINYTGHENDKFKSLVSCALAVCALVRASEFTDKERKERYINICQDHINKYWLKKLWVEEEGAFKFSETDYYSPNENRYVVNFNTMAVEGLLAVYNKTGNVEFREIALKTGEWLIERWNYTQETNKELLEGKITTSDDSDSERMPPGGFSYQFTDKNRKPDNYVTLYTGLALRGFCSLFKETGDNRYKEIIEAQSEYLVNMIDPETKLFYHTCWQGKIEKYPEFIAGAGMALVGLKKAEAVIGKNVIPKYTVQAIINKQYNNGSFPGFVGKNLTGKKFRTKGGVVWEDVAASMNWNAQEFEFLSEICENISIENSKNNFKHCYSMLSKRFFYFDCYGIVLIFSWSSLKSIGLFFILKAFKFSFLSFNLLFLYSKLLRLFRRGPINK